MTGGKRVLVILGTGLIAATVAGVVLYRWVSRDNSEVIPEQLPGVVRYDVSHGEDHTKSPVAYPQTPPAGGPHDPKWQNCGFYSGPVRNELAVHSLEHGAVWITYRTPLAEPTRQALIKLAESNDYVLVSAYDGLPAPFVVTAWRHQLRLTTYDQKRIDDFVRVFSGGTTAPEPIASCRGSLGRPDAH